MQFLVEILKCNAWLIVFLWIFIIRYAKSKDKFFLQTASNDGLHGQRPYDQPQHPAGHHTRRSRNNSDPDSHRRGPPQNRQYYPNPNSAYPGHCPPYYHGNQGGSPGYAPNQHHVSQHQGSSNCSREFRVIRISQSVVLTQNDLFIPVVLFIRECPKTKRLGCFLVINSDQSDLSEIFWLINRNNSRANKFFRALH